MHSAVWSIGQQVVRQALTAAFMLVVAKHLTPVELGLVGIAAIWSSLLAIFLDLGFGTALVQRKELKPSHIASVFALNLAAGAVLMLASIALAAPVAGLMHAPEAAPLIRVMSIGFILSALASVPNSLAQRELRFRDLAIRDFWASSISAAVGIALILHGVGVWSVVFATLVQNAVSMVLIWRLTSHRIHLEEARREHLAELWTYGSRIFSYTIFKYLLQNVDSLAVGTFFGPAALGIYGFTQRLILTPIRGVQSGVMAFLFPRASQSQDDVRALQNMYIRCVKMLTYVLVAYAIGLGTIGATWVTRIFGEQWADAVPIVRLMAIAIVVFPIMAPLGEMMKATGRTQWLLRWGVFFTLLTLGALVAGSHWGFHAAILAYVFAHFVALPIVTRLVRMTIRLETHELFSRLVLPYAALAALAAIGAGATLMGPVAALGIAIAVFTLFAVVVYRLDPDVRAISALLFRGTAFPLVNLRRRFGR